MWAVHVETKIFARVKAEGTRSLQQKYPDIYFTDSDRAQISPKFPTVYVHLLPSLEYGQDLEGTEVNAALFTFQIEVSHNAGTSQVREVSDEIMKIMKKMSFSAVSLPESQNTESVFRSVMRFRRMIAIGDAI